MARSMVKRAGAAVWCSKFEQAITDFKSIIANSDYCAALGDMEISRILKDIAAI